MRGPAARTFFAPLPRLGDAHCAPAHYADTRTAKEAHPRMAELKTPMDILKLLEKSNCRECGLPACLAFAAAVIRGEKQLSDCPRLDQSAHTVVRSHADQDQLFEQAMDQMKRKVAALDFAAAARRLGATFSHNRLCTHVLGKSVCLSPDGAVHTDIHVNRWVMFPLLQWILTGRNQPPSGAWIPYRELPGGKDRYLFFEGRCEKVIKRVADSDPDLFDDMISIFSGNRVATHYGSDISVVLHPLPCLPMLFCYWKPDGAMDSDLNIFFDATAEQNIDIESIFTLSTGLATMLENFAYRLA